MIEDAIIVGGSFAGLSAAMYIARARRRVCVIDAGAPRNRFAEHSHGFFGHDGSAPAALNATAKSQVAAYPTARFIGGSAASARRDGDVFAVTLDDGTELRGKGLLLTFGVSDELPAIEGLRERWGRTVLHCPYCHGFEFSDRRLGVLYASPMSAHQATLIAEWGPTTFFLNGAADIDSATLNGLARRGVAIEERKVKALRGEGIHLEAVELVDGTPIPLDALYIGAPTRLNSSIAEQLGCELEQGVFGALIKTDGQKQTTVPGVWAAGDIARQPHSATWASADGVTAGTALHRSLVF